MSALKHIYWNVVHGEHEVLLSGLILFILFALALVFSGADRNRLATSAIFIAFFIGIVIFFFLSPSGINAYDEGLILAGAQRILAGEIPSVDFYTNYGPAQFYIVAGLLDLFGNSLNVTRLYDSFVAAAILPASWWLLRDLNLRWEIPAALLLVFLLVACYRNPLYPITPVLLFMVVGSQVAIRALTGTWRNAGLVGLAVIISVITLFRYDLGLLVVAAFGIPILVVLILNYKSKSITTPQFLGAIGFALSAVGLALGVTIGILYWSGMLLPALHDILTYNSANYVEMRSLPFPGFSDWRDLIASPVVYLPIAASLIGLALSLFLRHDPDRQLQKEYIAVVVLTSATIFCYLKGIVRISPIHTLLSDVPAILLLFVSFSIVKPSFVAKSLLASKLVSIGGVLAVCLFATIYGGIAVKRSLFYHQWQHGFVTTGLPTLGVFSTDPDRVAAAHYIIGITTPTERILSATGRHDKVFLNDMAFYFLTNRLPATRWHHYDPGVQTTQDVQQEIIEDLGSRKTKIIIVERQWDDVREPNKSAESSGVFILDKYILQNFEPVRNFGSISIYRR